MGRHIRRWSESWKAEVVVHRQSRWACHRAKSSGDRLCSKATGCCLSQPAWGLLGACPTSVLFIHVSVGVDNSGWETFTVQRHRVESMTTMCNYAGCSLHKGVQPRCQMGRGKSAQSPFPKHAVFTWRWGTYLYLIHMKALNSSQVTCLKHNIHP